LFIGSEAMKAGKRSGCLRPEFRQSVVGDARELGRLVGRGDELERRIGEREHLLQGVELIEQGKPRIEIAQRRKPGKGGERHVTGNEIAEAIEIGLRHEMVEDIDHHRAAA
jgi:hypothetical protein